MMARSSRPFGTDAADLGPVKAAPASFNRPLLARNATAGRQNHRRAIARRTVQHIDAFAAAAIDINARANAVEIDVRQKDVLQHNCVWETILVGDMCYERPLAERLLGWLTDAAKKGALVLLGDPGRNYFPKSGVEKLAAYQVATSRELEDRDVRATAVYRLGAGPT